MGLLEDARKKNSSGSLLRKYRSKFDISDDSINETLSSIKTTMENDRLKTVYESQGVGDVQNQIAEKEKPAEGFLGIGLFSGAQRDYRDIFKREEKDSEYRSQIEKNVKTISELLKKKKENPDKANDYDVMLKALQDKNKMLVEATGGDIKDLSTGKLALRSVETATDVMPFGAGITQAGRAVLKSGTKAVIGSLAKEGAATGIIGGAATAGQRENTTLSQFLGDVATSAIVSAATTVGLGLGMNKLGDKVGNWLRGDKVDFTPKEKDALADVPELQDEALFEQAGIESPIKKTDDDLMSETVSSTNNPETIAEILKTKIPDEQTRAKVAKQLEVIEDPDEVKRIIDSYDPVKIREDLALKIATTDNEKRIASFLKGIVSDDDIPTLSRTMKGMEDETQIMKLLDEFQIKGESVIESPKVDVTPVENVTDTKTVEKKNIPESPLLKESKIGDVLTQVNKGGELIDVTRENYSKYRDILPRRTRQELDTKAQYNPEWNKGKQAQGGAESTFLQEAKKYSTPKNQNEPIATSTVLTKSKLSKTTLRDAIKKGMEVDQSDIPMLGTMNLDDQSDRFMKLISEHDSDFVEKVMTKEIDSPDQKLLPGSIYSGLKRIAIENKDYAEVYRLSRMKDILGFARRSGQESKAFDARLKFDPDKMMDEMVDLKKEIASKSGIDTDKVVAETRKEMQDFVDKTVSTDSDLSKTINDIKCK